MRFSARDLLFVLASLFFTLGVSGQVLDPLSTVPGEQRDALYKRLDGYVGAFKHREWVKLYGFISTVGRAGVDVQTFVVSMNSNHGEDFAQFPDLQTFTPARARKNRDGYDILGCAGAVREGEPFRGIAEVHAVFEHENWFFTGCTFRDSSEESCKQLSDPNWRPDSAIEWNRPMQELAHAH
jgi:hypothetical protein